MRDTLVYRNMSRFFAGRGDWPNIEARMQEEYEHRGNRWNYPEASNLNEALVWNRTIYGEEYWHGIFRIYNALRRGEVANPYVVPIKKEKKYAAIYE